MIGDPCVNVECDVCGEVEQFQMTALARNSWDNRNLLAKLKRSHWHVNGEITICPECYEDESNE